ncbi:hypothetical protein ROZALSC1DRAFT_25486, partial [Rozella allomycis CSF55]
MSTQADISESLLRSSLTCLLVDSFGPVARPDEETTMLLREYVSNYSWWKKQHSQYWDISDHQVTIGKYKRCEPIAIFEEKSFGFKQSNSWTCDVPVSAYNSNSADLLKTLRSSKMLLLRRTDVNEGRSPRQFAIVMQGFQFKIFICTRFHKTSVIATEVYSGELIEGNFSEIKDSKELLGKILDSDLPIKAIHVFLALRLLLDEEASVARFDESDQSKQPIAGDHKATPMKPSKGKEKVQERLEEADTLENEAGPSMPPSPTNRYTNPNIPFLLAPIGISGLTKPYDDLREHCQGYIDLRPEPNCVKYEFNYIFTAERVSDDKVVLIKTIINTRSNEDVLATHVKLSSLPHATFLLDFIKGSEYMFLLFNYYYPLTINPECLYKCESLTIKMVLEIGLAISEFLLALHQLGFCHCDINPSNILTKSIINDQLSKDDVFICDYGGVRRFETEVSNIFGVTGFTHPLVDSLVYNTSNSRQIAIELEPAIDLYGFGATLNWLLSKTTRDSVLEDHTIVA